MAIEIMAWDLNVMSEYLGRGTSLQQHCEETKYIMALHFSHAATNKFGYLPDERPILIAAFLDRWSKLCGGPAFHFGDDAGIEDSPSNTDDASSNAISDALYDTDGTMAISRENSFLYVHIPKTGGSTFDQSSLFSDALSHHQIGGHHPIDAITKNAEEREMSDFVKAAHIRHPCDRFVSAFAYLTSDICNSGDKEWRNTYIGDKSIDEFVLELEQKPKLLQWAHFTPMWRYVFNPDGIYGIDATLCQETWDESLDKLSNDFNLPVPDGLHTSHTLKNKHSKCEDLSPETKAAIKRIYQMDYCIFQYDDLPQQSCPQLNVPPEEFTKRYQTCAAPKLGPGPQSPQSRRRLGDAAEAQRLWYHALTPTRSMSPLERVERVV